MANKRASGSRRGTKKVSRSRKKRPSRIRRLARGVTATLAAVFLAGVLFVGWILLSFPHRGPGGTGVARVEIPPDAGAAEVSRILADEGLVEDPFLFSTYLRLTRRRGPYRSGRVRFGRGAAHSVTATRVASGAARGVVRVVIPEGWTRYDIAERLEAQGICSAHAFLRATTHSPAALMEFVVPEWRAEDLPPLPDNTNAEGYLFPDTYELLEGSVPSDVAARMIRNWQRRMQGLLEEHPDALARLHPTLDDLHDVVNLASVVEKEAVRADERATIAGVFLNRLRSDTFRPRHRLQADPTVSYGCLARPDLMPCAEFDGRSITQSMLADADNPYNSYRHAGLPPTPIANPGLASLRATLVPEEHDLLYFVARGGGRHSFSADLPSHNVAVEHYREMEDN